MMKEFIERIGVAMHEGSGVKWGRSTDGRFAEMEVPA